MEAVVILLNVQWNNLRFCVHFNFTLPPPVGLTTGGLGMIKAYPTAYIALRNGAARFVLERYE